MRTFAKTSAPSSPGKSISARGLAARTHPRPSAIYGSGSALPESVRGHAEARFDFDFSRVKVHTGTDAAGASRSLNARAFTIGEHVFFGAGEFQPESSAGQRLVAHELTHVVQQSRGVGKAGHGENSAAEAEARRNAADYGNRPVDVKEASGAGIARAPLASVDVSKLDADALEARAQTLDTWFRRHLTDDPDYPAQLQAAVDVYQAMSAQGVGPPYPLDTEGLKAQLIAESPRSPFELRIRRGELPEYRAVFKDGIVIGYLRSSGGYTEMRDIDGNFVWSDEIGLETPLLDPIDLIPFELVGSLVAKAGSIGLRAAAKVGAKIVAKDVAKIVAKDAAKVAVKEAAKVGTKEVVEGAAKAGVKDLAKAAGKTAADDAAKAGAKDVAKAAGKAGADDAAKAGGKKLVKAAASDVAKEAKTLVEVFRKGKKFKSVAVVSLKRLRNVLGRAGVSPSAYKLVKVSAEVSRAMEKEVGETIWGWVSRDAAGTVARDARGRPIINFTERALSSLEEAVKTFGHEAKHLKDFAAGLTESSEALAEQAGEKLWVIVQESLGG